MIQVVQQPDADLLRQVSDYLAHCQPDSGSCAEHDPRWLDVLRHGLGHQPCLLIARRNGHADTAVSDAPLATSNQSNTTDICGYLPLMLVASPLFGRFLVSLPYLNRAGIVADSPQVATQLLYRAVELAQQKNVRYLELRHHGSATPDHPSLNATLTSKSRMVLDLPSSPDALWKQLTAKVRNQVRKGDKAELSIQWGGTELLDDFYAVFAVNMRDLGTPVYPRKLFAAILEQFPGQAELAVVRHQQDTVATALLIHALGSTQVPSASCLRQFNHTNANMWMYHQLLLRSIECGSHQFDFGRSSKDSGTYRFKKQWGARPQPTCWQYHLRRGDFSSMRPDSPRNRWRVETWKKLPVWLTRQIGPMIVRGIP